MNYDCFLPCHSTLGPNKHFLFSITWTVIMSCPMRLYSLSYLFLPLFIVNLLFSFQEINSTSDTDYTFAMIFSDLDILTTF